MDNNNFEKLKRISVPSLDNILGTPFKVLNDGFVRVVDYMGSDDSIVQAARVSYGKGTKKISEDRGLIRYLLRHQHTTPFEMCEIKLHIRVPMDCWRQWIRHRTANVNEYSTRYSIAIDSAQRTDPKKWRSQSANNKQGSGDYLNEEIGFTLSEKEIALQNEIWKIYEERIEQGVAKEQARKDLPLSTYTEAYWKIDLHNLLNFLRLRMDPHAQTEIREYATVIGNQIVKEWCPITWEAFEDYQLHSLKLTKFEIKILNLLLSNKRDEAMQYLVKIGFLNKEGGIKLSRERDEFEKKLTVLDIKAPWM